MGFQREHLPFGGGQGGNAPKSSVATDEIFLGNKSLLLFFADAALEAYLKGEFRNYVAKEEFSARENIPNSRFATAFLWRSK